MKCHHIGERSDGSDEIASKVHFDRLKGHRKKKNFASLVIKKKRNGIVKLSQMENEYWIFIEKEIDD